MRINCSITETELIEGVENLLFGCDYSIQEICDHFYMTESELRAIPEIDDLFNK